MPSAMSRQRHAASLFVRSGLKHCFKYAANSDMLTTDPATIAVTYWRDDLLPHKLISRPVCVE